MVAIKVFGGGLEVGDLGTSSSILEYWKVEEEMKYPDVLIIEATYGGKKRPSRREVERAFMDKVREALERRGKVLVPVSSVGKFQEVYKILRDNEKKLPTETIIYLEGLGLFCFCLLLETFILVNSRVVITL